MLPSFPERRGNHGNDIIPENLGNERLIPGASGTRKSGRTGGRRLIPPPPFPWPIARGAEIYTIARNMGTSVKMIEQYFLHAIAAARARKLGGKERSYQRPAYDEIEPTPEQKQQRAERQRERLAAKKA